MSVRWIRPVWLTIPQAQVYSSLPPRVLRALLANKRLRRAGSKIYRDSIDSVLLEAVPKFLVVNSTTTSDTVQMLEKPLN